MQHPLPARTLVCLPLLAAAPTPARAQGAQPPDAAALPVGGVSEPGFIVVVGDPTGRLGEGARAVLAGEGAEVEIPLHDDGEPPDAAGGDGVWTGMVDPFPRGDTTLTVMDAGGAALFTDQVPVGQVVRQPKARLVLAEDRVHVAFATFRDTSEEAPVSQQAQGAGAPGGTAALPTASEPPRERGPGGFLAVLFALVLGGGAGGVAGWVARGRWTSAPSLQPVHPGREVAMPPGLPPARAGQQIWVVPDVDGRRAVLAALAEHLAPGGPIVLVPERTSRAWLAERLEGVCGVFWLEEDRPEVEPVVDALRTLSAVAPSVALVEGLDALEPPDPDEPPDAVLEELLDATEDALVAVVTADERIPRNPTVRLVPVEGGLAPEGADRPVIRVEAGRARVS